MAKAADEREIASRFVAALLKRQERQPRGWVAQLARDTGIALTTLSHVVKGRRLPTVRQMLQIADALGAREILPPELAQPSAPQPTSQIRWTGGGGSDLPATVAAKPVPKDLAEYLAGKGQDERVTVGEFVRLAKASFLEEGKPRSADFWRGILLAIRSE